MEPATKIKLPVAYKTMSKIDNKLQSLNKTGSEKILSFVGSNEVEAMFYLYLFKKYKSNCFLLDKNVKTRIIGMAIEIKENYNSDEEQQIMTQLDNLSKSLVDCIKNVNSEVIIIPVQLLLEPGKGHANILIYRKKLNQIEHFEPHGRQFLGNQKMQQYNEIIERWIQFFVLQLNSKLKLLFKKQRDVKFINSSEVCPRIDGLQTLEAWSNLTNIADLEPGGYCTAWSLFFTELCLKNPEVPSYELMNYIFNILERMDNITKRNYLKGVIRGYSVFINEKISKYFSVFFNYGLTIEKLKKFPSSDLSKFRLILRYLIDLEISLSTDPSHLRSGLIKLKHKLNEFNGRLKINSNDIDLKKQIEKLTNKKKIYEIYEKFNVVSNPSKTNSSRPKLVLEKTCPEGKELNPISGRCIKIKTVKVKMVKEKVKKEKTCPEGKVLNPNTGRCVKVKSVKVNPKKVKTQKVKPEIMKPEIMKPACPEGEVLKCVKVNTKEKTEKVKTEKVKTEKVKKEKVKKEKVKTKKVKPVKDKKNKK